jgi:hypothetical protein
MVGWEQTWARSCRSVPFRSLPFAERKRESRRGSHVLDNVSGRPLPSDEITRQSSLSPLIDYLLTLLLLLLILDFCSIAICDARLVKQSFNLISLLHHKLMHTEISQ